MSDIGDFSRLAGLAGGLCVVATTRADGSIQASVVTAGVFAAIGSPAVAFTVRGTAHKLGNLRARPRATIIARAGYQWVAVEGFTQLLGPDDPEPGVGPEHLRALLREAFTAAGGTHDDWDTYDQVMAAERRAVVLVRPAGVYGNHEADRT